MKLLLSLTLLFTMSAEASYYATFCANARGTVKWESGHNSNTISFKYWTDVETTKTISINEVEIKVDETHVIKDVRTNCNYNHERQFVANATITASPDHPTALDFLNSQDPLEAVVICEFHMNSRGGCPGKP
jgi:hypothetical protein